MGLLSRLLGKKEKLEEPAKKEELDNTELTEDDLKEVFGHTPYSDWCPKAKVEPIDIRGKQTGIKTIETQDSLGR